MNVIVRRILTTRIVVHYEIINFRQKRRMKGQSDDSCLSTQDASQMNCRDPVCPDLVQCDASVDEILPQLTSSMW